MQMFSRCTLTITVLILGIDGSHCHHWALAQNAKKKPMAPQTYHTSGGGGLIDGACIGVEKENVAVIRTAERQTFKVPLELFDAGDQKLICEHFGIDFPLLQPKEPPPPRDSLHPWHSIRGGVMVSGKIVALQGDVLKVLDEQGRVYRIPTQLLASGAAVHAKDAIAKLDPSQRIKRARPKSSKATTGNDAPAVEDGAVEEKGTPASVAVQAKESKENSKMASPPQSPSIPARVWRDPQGKILAQGRFIERRGQEKIAVANLQGKEMELSWNMLSEPCKDFVESVSPSARSSTKLQPKGELRKWKSRFGIDIAEGRFLEIKEGSVICLRENGARSTIPLVALADADFQYAKALAAGRLPSKAPVGAIVVNSGVARLAVSADRRNLWLIDEGRFLELSADAGKIESEKSLPAKLTHLQERNEYFVGSVDNKVLFLDKDSLKPIKTIELSPYQSINQIALHPKLKIAYLSVKNSAAAIRQNPDERQRLVRFDEVSGQTKELGAHFATWLTVHPSGKWLITAFKDVHETIGDIRINGDGKILETPKFENTDILLRYRITEQTIEQEQVLENAGANGQGLVISPDGKYTCYPSFTGYPTYSGNIALLHSDDFSKKPITLPVKDFADTKRIYFHPTLPLAVAPGLEGGLVAFKTTDGEHLKDAIKVPQAIQGYVVHDVAFLPDGNRIAAIVSLGGGDRFVAMMELVAIGVR